MSDHKPLPNRGEHGTWCNYEPITNLAEALDFLTTDGSSSEPYHLHRSIHGDGWELAAPWYREGSSGGDSSGTDYYQIGQSLAQRMIEKELVEQLLVKFHGGSYRDKDKLVVTRRGSEAQKLLLAKAQRRALRMLIPGKHTDLTGEPQSAGWGRDQWRYGRQYFEYCGPSGNRFRVFPVEHTIEEIA